MIVSVTSTVSILTSGLKVCIISHVVTPPFFNIYGKINHWHPRNHRTLKRDPYSSLLKTRNRKGQERSSESFTLHPTLCGNCPLQLTFWRGVKPPLFPHLYIPLSCINTG